MAKTILITGAGSGFGEASAIGLAKNGHKVIATAQFSPQVDAASAKRRRNSASSNLHVDEARPARSLRRRLCAEAGAIDVLWNNAGVGESGPVFEIPLDLVRRNFEVNVFTPLVLTQSFIRSWIGNEARRRRSSSPRRWEACSRRLTGASTCLPSTR